MKNWQAVLFLVCFVAVLILSLWAWFAGPCELYQFTRSADVPARCLMH